MLRRLLFVASCSIGQALAGSVSFPRFVEDSFRIDSLSELGSAGIVVTDLDGDGVAEMVAHARSGILEAWPLLAVFERTGDALRIVHGKTIPYGDGLKRILSWTHEGESHLITVGRDGTVRDYTGRSLIEQRQFATTGFVSSAAIGDVDADGRDELIVLSQSAVGTYDLATGQIKQIYPAEQFYDVTVAQLDADPALEIILTGWSTRVLDGATYAAEWSDSNLTGEKTIAGRFGPAGAIQWVNASTNVFTVLGSAPWAVRWSGHVDGLINAVGAIPRGAGIDSIAVASMAGLDVYDSQQQSLLYQLASLIGPVNAVASGDVDADGTDEIVLALPPYYPDSPGVIVADATDGSIDSILNVNTTPYLLTAVGDVDGDGRLEIVAATRGYYGALEVFDLASGRSLWRRTLASLAGSTSVGAPTGIALASRAGHPGLDIVLACGRVLVIDAVLREVRFATGAPYPYVFSDVVAIDYDQDGIDDIALASGFSNSSTSVIRVLSGRDGSPLWTSVEMGSAFMPIRQVLAVGGDTAQPRRQLVALMSDSLRFYDVQTGLLDWVLPIEADRAVYVPGGAEGAEIATFKQNGEIAFHSLVTRLPTRQYALPSPLRALQPLGGGLDRMVAAAAGQLVLLDGANGSVAASSDQLTPLSENPVVLTTVQRSDAVWQTIVGSAVGLHRHRIVLDDAIFADGLDEH